MWLLQSYPSASKIASDLRRFGEHKLLLAARLLRLAVHEKRALQQRLQPTRTTVTFSADSRISLCEKTEACSNAP